MTRKSLVLVALSAFVTFVFFGAKPPIHADVLLLLVSPIANFKHGLVLGILLGIPGPFAAIAGRYGFILRKDEMLYEMFFLVSVGLNIGFAASMFFFMSIPLISALAYTVSSVAAVYGYYRFASWIFTRNRSPVIS